MYRLDVCKCHCETIGRSRDDSHRTVVKSVKAHVDIYEYTETLSTFPNFLIRIRHIFRFIREVSTAFSLFILAQGILSLMLLTVTIFYSKLVRTTN